MSYDYNNLSIGKLDYESIKNNLVTFLKKYPQFVNYDFDNPASAINLFIDILAANTAYNGYYLHSVLTNAFPITSTTKRAMYLNAHLRGAFVAEKVSARSTVILRNTGSEVPRLTPFSAVQPNGSPCFFYCLDPIPTTADDDTISVEVIGGENISSLSSFNTETLTLPLSFAYDPTALLFSTLNADDTKTYWTQVNSFSSSTDTKIFTVINGSNGYYVTTNIPGAETPTTVYVDAIVSNGTFGNSSTILSVADYPSVEIVSFTTPSGGKDSTSREYLKTYVPYVSATNDRIVTQNDYIEAVYAFMLSKNISIIKSNISVTSPQAGTVRIYISDLPSTIPATSARSQMMTSYLPERKMAGIVLEYGA